MKYKGRREMEKPIFEIRIEKSPFKNRRDEIISTFVDEINRLRTGTKFKPVTKKYIAIRANSNPFLKSDGELDYVLKECLRKGSFSHFFWITK